MMNDIFSEFFKKRSPSLFRFLLFLSLLFLVKSLPRVSYLLSEDILSFIIAIGFLFFFGLDEIILLFIIFYFLALIIFLILVGKKLNAENLANVVFFAFCCLVFKKITDFLKIKKDASK